MSNCFYSHEGCCALQEMEGEGFPPCPYAKHDDLHCVLKECTATDDDLMTEEEYEELSRCKNGCGCMTHTLKDGLCAKCKKVK